MLSSHFQCSLLFPSYNCSGSGTARSCLICSSCSWVMQSCVLTWTCGPSVFHPNTDLFLTQSNTLLGGLLFHACNGSRLDKLAHLVVRFDSVDPIHRPQHRVNSRKVDSTPSLLFLPVILAPVCGRAY